MICVNALNGLSSFLPKTIRSKGGRRNLCQRPKRALFISTERKTHLQKNFLGVNALNRLSSFLQSITGTGYSGLLESVNALNGLSSFLRTVARNSNRHSDRCQRPKRALFISTQLQTLRELRSNMCVNALNGLSSFLH